MGAFSLKSVLLARHAQHVVLIHFPIALFLMGVAFDCAARWTKREAFATVAFYNLMMAAVFVLPVLVTGLLAWQWQLEAQRLHGVLLLHLTMGCISGALILGTAWIHLRGRRKQSNRGGYYLLAFEVVAALVIAATAHLGGILSGVNGPA